MSDFRRNSAKFTHEYPVVLSTTYSIKGTLSIEHIYDYLIVDEASQVDLATGVLAFSCARNIVIVGDLKQLPNVLTEDDIRTMQSVLIGSEYPVMDTLLFYVENGEKPEMSLLTRSRRHSSLTLCSVSRAMYCNRQT